MIEAGSAAWSLRSARELSAVCTALRGLGACAGHGDAELAETGGEIDADAAELVDQIRGLEELKAAAAAAQARVTARFAAVQRAVRRAAGEPASEAGKGIGAQVALARRDSPHRGSRHLGVAEALCYELPHTMAALAAGETSEWRATLVVRETACLSREHRRQVDAELAARPGGLGAMGDRAIAMEARRVGYRLDPYAATDRAARAAQDRRVTLRPAPDTMGLVTGLLPVQQAVAAYAALSQFADSRRAQGDQRSRGQLMADAFVERLTGQAVAAGVPVEVNLVMSDRSLLGDGTEPAELEGYGPVPAPLARDWLRGSSGAGTSETTATAAQGVGATGDGVANLVEQAQVWLRRLYTAPDTGALVAMDSRRRYFDGQLRRFVITRDQRCRTSWCDAPIRHVDHPVPAAASGRTSAENSQGLCEACNYTKDISGWRATPVGSGAVETITPTGHAYVSHRPPVMGRPPPPPPGVRDIAAGTAWSRLEISLERFLHAA